MHILIENFFQKYTPLHAAAARGHSVVVDLLLQNDADVDGMNAYGNTPLHIACLNGHKSVCIELLYRNANINAINYRGQVSFCVGFSVWNLLKYILVSSTCKNLPDTITHCCCIH